jgi:uncharacterized membrane protein YfcA
LLVLVLLAAIAAGGTAALAGFGVGSILTPVFTLETDTKSAVAAVSIPHFCATAYRLWLMRAGVNRHVLIRFGVPSAIGGILGAALHTTLATDALTLVFAALLIFAGTSGLTGLSGRFRLTGPAATVGGALSGLLGGLVGNQGGIRSAALLEFTLPKREFVATATAIALIIDTARMPFYFATEAGAIGDVWELVAIATVGALIGTAVGAWGLRRLPETVFQRAVSVLILTLGVTMAVSLFV